MKSDFNKIRAYTGALVYLFFLLGCQSKPLAEESPSNILKTGGGDGSAKVLSDQEEQYGENAPETMRDALQSAIQKVYTTPGELPRLTVEVDEKNVHLPLKHTHVTATIVGYVAEVEVTQSYENPFEYPIEAVYVFPLPENSAVNDMKIVIGDRVIEAEIKKRADARQTYESAVRQGHTAALLEQERPNVFTQSVANIAPGGDIDVDIRYVQNLTYDAGEYEFVFPMVVGPRFIPGSPTGSTSGTGWAQDTQEVPDAARITPALVGDGMRTGHDISLALHVEAGFPITHFTVPTHKTSHTLARDGSLNLALASADEIPNRDFVLKFSVGGQDPQATVLTHETNKQSYFSLLIQPPMLDMEKHVGMREIIFVVDVSGSMSGVPLAMCKHAMEKAINGLRPMDTFNVITFESRTGKAFEKSRPANDVNIDEALGFVSGMRAGGGTMMGSGVKAAFANDAEEGRHQYVFFMTDGYIGNEHAIMSMIRKFVSTRKAHGHSARVFSMGVGSSVNRHLLNGIANAGRGVAVYATRREDPAKSIDKIYRYIDHPILEDIQIDWGDIRVRDVYPENPGDLFASHPVIVHGRFLDSFETSTILIKGRIDGRDVTLPVKVSPHGKHRRSVLVSLWARSKIDWLEKSLIYQGRQSSVVDQITRLGLSHRLVTAYTSFVAVDRSKKVKGKIRTIAQPVDTPEGVDARMAGAMVIAEKIGRRETEAARGHYGYSDLGTLNTVGHGAGGYGRGAGGLGGRRRTGPKIRVGEVVTNGSRAKEVIRRIVHRHINEVKFCYERSLSTTLDLSGRVVVEIDISSTGTVRSAAIKSSTLNNEKVENCLIKTIERWTFLQSDRDKTVIVPLQIETGDGL